MALNTGDIAFMLVATALVMLMTPGLALFYGGLVRSKNVLATTMQSFLCLGIVSLIWVVYGYSLAFGPDVGSVIGNLDFAFLNNVSWEKATTSSTATIPDLLYCAFQLMFAIITPALITGAFAERMKFSAYLIFTALWLSFVYLPICHWVWGGGWLQNLGALDFAGGTVIHINSGAAALVCALVIGKRKGFGKEAFHPHNIPMTVLGAGILWFGWFGFNAGSALSAGPVAVLALMTTQVATGTASLAWAFAEWKIQGRPTTLGAASGAVAGLVAITPAAGFVTPLAAIVIGLVAGVICYLAVTMKGKIGYDDALDVVAVHGVGGLWGALATGLFATVGGTGLFYGNPRQLVVQAIACGSVILWSVVVTFIILKIVDAVVGLRVETENEVQGLDVTEHSEVGYTF